MRPIRISHGIKLSLATRVDLILVLSFFCFAFYVNNAYALIYGLVYPAHAVSTLQINIQHEHYLRSVSKWEYYDSKCSAVVVGVKPLTLLTAAHCLNEVKLTGLNRLPEIEILYAKENGLENLKITKAFYRPYHEVAENITLDIAVLVFDGQVDQYVKPIPIAQKLPQDNKLLLLCGYGKGYLEADSKHPRCKEKSFLTEFSEFKKVLPEHYQSKDEMLYIKSEAQFNYTKEIALKSDTLLAVHRINEQGFYHEKLAMVTEGDSGGPWFALDKNQQYSLVAITTLVERFYNKNVFWDFFSRDTPLSEYPYVAYGLRLDNEDVHTFLEYCKNSGADILFESK